jgi:hypothetical protein
VTQPDDEYASPGGPHPGLYLLGCCAYYGALLYTMAYGSDVPLWCVFLLGVPVFASFVAFPKDRDYTKKPVRPFEKWCRRIGIVVVTAYGAATAALLFVGALVLLSVPLGGVLDWVSQLPLKALAWVIIILLIVVVMQNMKRQRR